MLNGMGCVWMATFGEWSRGSAEGPQFDEPVVSVFDWTTIDGRRERGAIRT